MDYVFVITIFKTTFIDSFHMSRKGTTCKELHLIQEIFNFKKYII